MSETKPRSLEQELRAAGVKIGKGKNPNSNEIQVSLGMDQYDFDIEKTIYVELSICPLYICHLKKDIFLITDWEITDRKNSVVIDFKFNGKIIITYEYTKED